MRICNKTLNFFHLLSIKEADEVVVRRRLGGKGAVLEAFEAELMTVLCGSNDRAAIHEVLVFITLLIVQLFDSEF